MTIYKKMRLDRLLVESGLAPTRSRAADLVRRGCVQVGGVLAAKPGALIAGDAALSVEPGAALYVSRGGLKLAAALDDFGLDPAGRVALDIGASTGGFTEVLLERGASTPSMSAAISSTRIFAATQGWSCSRGPTQESSRQTS